MGDDQIGITAPKTFLSKQFDMKDMGLLVIYLALRLLIPHLATQSLN